MTLAEQANIQRNIFEDSLRTEMRRWGNTDAPDNIYEEDTQRILSRVN